ncbi:MAG: hypothetical protein ACRDD8_09835 [Bacteroidales bacterium]
MEIKGDKVYFDIVNDKDIYLIKDENGRTMAELKGYNVEIIFNLDVINTKEDIDTTVNGIAELFREKITEQLLDNK